MAIRNLVMLKITWDDKGVGETMKTLEERRLGRPLEEVRLMCEHLHHGGSALTLDLEDVSFLDPGGAALLRQLVCQNFATSNLAPLSSIFLIPLGSIKGAGNVSNATSLD